MAVEIGAVDEEASPLDHILCYHTEAIQYITQFTGAGWEIRESLRKKEVVGREKVRSKQIRKVR